MKLTKVADVDSHEEQDAPVDNTCYMKLASKLKYLLGLHEYILGSVIV